MLKNKIASINKCKMKFLNHFVTHIDGHLLPMLPVLKLLLLTKTRMNSYISKKSYPKDNFQNNALYFFTKIDNCLIITFNLNFLKKYCEQPYSS